jgi:hypothetical protein
MFQAFYRVFIHVIWLGILQVAISLPITSDFSFPHAVILLVTLGMFNFQTELWDKHEIF